MIAAAALAASFRTFGAIAKMALGNIYLLHYRRLGLRTTGRPFVLRFSVLNHHLVMALTPQPQFQDIRESMVKATESTECHGDPTGNILFSNLAKLNKYLVLPTVCLNSSFTSVSFPSI